MYRVSVMGNRTIASCQFLFVATKQTNDQVQLAFDTRALKADIDNERENGQLQ